jgi:hypothetical protein
VDKSSKPKLALLPCDAGPWTDGVDKDARETLERILAEFDRFVVVGIRRDGPGGMEWTYAAGARQHPVTSLMELTGSLHAITRDLEDEE